jgi:type I restriction-modification system DNA methylase subunit
LRNNKLTGIYEDQYLQLVGKYKENTSQPRGSRPIDAIADAWGMLLQETQEYNQDVLGEIYESQISFGEHGQYFTPVHVTDMMAQVIGASAGETVSDPCVGSGRFFISLAKLKKDLRFVGVDISPTCAKMTALNMWLFDLNADIYCGDSLTGRMSQLWKIRTGGYIFEEKVESMPEPYKTTIKIQAQQSLFDGEELKAA